MSSSARLASPVARCEADERLARDQIARCRLKHAIEMGAPDRMIIEAKLHDADEQLGGEETRRLLEHLHQRVARLREPILPIIPQRHQVDAVNG